MSFACELLRAQMGQLCHLSARVEQLENAMSKYENSSSRAGAAGQPKSAGLAYHTAIPKSLSSVGNFDIQLSFKDARWLTYFADSPYWITTPPATHAAVWYIRARGVIDQGAVRALEFELTFILQ